MSSATTLDSSRLIEPNLMVKVSKVECVGMHKHPQDSLDRASGVMHSIHLNLPEDAAACSRCYNLVCEGTTCRWQTYR